MPLQGNIMFPNKLKEFFVLKFFKVTLGYLFCLQSVKWEDEWNSFCVQFLPSDWSLVCKNMICWFLMINSNTTSNPRYEVENQKEM